MTEVNEYTNHQSGVELKSAFFYFFSMEKEPSLMGGKFDDTLRPISEKSVDTNSSSRVALGTSERLSAARYLMRSGGGGGAKADLGTGGLCTGRSSQVRTSFTVAEVNLGAIGSPAVAHATFHS
jgi:hypothetical protein